MESVPDDAIVPEPDWGYRVGDTVRLWLADGSEARLRVVRLLPPGAATAAHVSPRNARAGLPSTALVDVRPGDDPAAVEAALRRAAEGHRAAVVSKRQWSAAAAGGRASASRLGLLMVLGTLLTYTTIALVNTLVMGAPDRTGPASGAPCACSAPMAARCSVTRWPSRWWPSVSGWCSRQPSPGWG